MKLPMVISVPHAGLAVPEEVQDQCVLSRDDIIADGDEFAGDIYLPIEKHVQCFQTTQIARAFLDMNRAKDDFRMDGVVKTHTCWQKKIYKQDLTQNTVNTLLEKYYFPYHRQLTEFAAQSVKIGIDCHTMADKGPPVGPDTGQKRPDVCLSAFVGKTPSRWIEHMLALLKQQFDDVRLNEPFQGGYIMRQHQTEIPWIQLELRRGGIRAEEKSRKIIAVFKNWCEAVLPSVLP